MVAITTTLFPGLRKQLGWGSSDFLRAAGLFWIKKHGESPHFQQGRGFQSDQKQRQTAEGRESEVSSAESTALSTGGPYAARLSSRKVVRFDGPEVIQFLQVWFLIQSGRLRFLPVEDINFLDHQSPVHLNTVSCTTVDHETSLPHFITAIPPRI